MRTLGLAAMLALMLVPLASAHAGHDHKIMGTVSAITDARLDVKTTTGKMTSITLTDKTQVIRGTMAMTIGDVKVGDRVVVMASAEGKGSLTAKQVRLGATSTKPRK